MVETGEHPLVQPHTVRKVGRADRTRVYKVIARDDLRHAPDRKSTRLNSSHNA